MCKSTNAGLVYQDTYGRYTEFNQNLNVVKKKDIWLNIKKIIMKKYVNHFILFIIV